MIFERIKSEGLAHLSYLIASGGEAAVVDPRRDSQIYADIAERSCLEIRYIFETHRNEDYVIGSRELEHLTGAEICHSRELNFQYGDHNLRDGDEFEIGDLKIQALYTPGHTNESLSYALSSPSEGERPFMIFTGDTLFVGDVGRVDLYGSEKTAGQAALLYESIHRKLLPLGDSVIICPSHWAGSVCGSQISRREMSTIGYERLYNPPLQLIKEAFIEHMVQQRLTVPPYFKRMEELNLKGAPLLKELPPPRPLTPQQFKGEMEKGAVVIDARMPKPSAGVTSPVPIASGLAAYPSTPAGS